MNIQTSKKYGLSPEEIKSRALKSERFRTLHNMHRIEKTGKLNIRMDRYDQTKYSKKRKKLRENLNIGERVYVLAERIKKKSAPGNFYKQSVQNISFFNKDTVYTIRKKQMIDGIRYYWVKKSNCRLTKASFKVGTFCTNIKFFVKKQRIFSLL